MKKSSFHFFTGDVKLSIFGKVVYVLSFLIEFFVLNIFPLSKKDFNPKIEIDDIKEFHGLDMLNNVSPQRIVSNAAIIELVKDINFSYLLDLGCGSGIYKKYFKNLGKNFEYLGIDIKRHNNNEIIQHDLGPSFPNLKEKASNIDFIFSQSALEHIKYDIEVIRWSVNNFPNANHLHIIPAPLSAICYNLHGYRRYSNYTLKKIIKCFPSNIEVFSIGNNSTRKLYMGYFREKFDKKHKFDKFVGSINYSDWLSQASPLKKLSSNKNGGPEFYAILYNKLKNDK